MSCIAKAVLRWTGWSSVLVMLCVLGSAFAQTTISTGSIQGTVSDPTGAGVEGAQLTITNRDTGQTLRLSTTSTGTYASGALVPGNYLVRAASPGFKTTELSLIVQVGITASGNIKLNLGQITEVVSVTSSAVQVNTEQATIQGVLTKQQIENLPINGRNYIDLAQLEPGVQTQDVSGVSGTQKIGHAGISVGGRYSGSTVVEIDGLDLSDGTGSSLANISASAIQEFSISQASMDMSSESTNAGAVNVVTRTGTNALHGEALYLFRDRRLAANSPGGFDAPYQRHDFAGNLGGPILKDRLFFFVNGEHYKQDLGVPVNVPPPLDGLSAVVQQPLHETLLQGRLDYNAPKGVRFFYRFSYDNNKVVGNFQPTFQLVRQVDNTPSHAVGADFSSGRLTHSVRFGYVKNAEPFEDAVGPGVFNPLTEASVRFGARFQFGTNSNLPLASYRSNQQIKYDGSWIRGSHIIRYGFGYTRIVAGGLSGFGGLKPVLRSTLDDANIDFANHSCGADPCFPGGESNPLNYPVAGPRSIQLGNGQSFLNNTSAFGFPGGGNFDNRIQWYVGDAWKVRSNFTLNYGVRYVRDTGIVDNDLAPVPCSAIDTSTFPDPGLAPHCDGNILDMFGTGLSRRPRQDNNNFAPQVGFAWAITNDSKTVLRAGAGLFYAVSAYSGFRQILLPKGLFNFAADSSTGQGCASGSFRFPGGEIVTMTPDGTDIATGICGHAIGKVASQVAALQQEFQAATAAAGPLGNPQFIGETLDPSGLPTPNYRTSYSYEMNVGIQREIRPGVVLSADYVRNVSLHYLLGIDVNHVGDSRFLNKTAALNAIDTTNSLFGCPAGVGGIDCSIAAGATMEDFAGNGVTSTTLFTGGAPALFGLDPDHGAAFPGINPEVGQGVLNLPIGRAVYNALQISLRQRTENPFRFAKSLNLQFSYSLSRYTNPLGSSAFNNDNQDGFPGAADFRHPLANSGPAAFDRTHQFSLGTTIDFAKSLRFGVIAHVYSPLSQSLTVEDQGRAGEIFYTDFTGDGTTGDLLPGTRVGAFGRDVKAGKLTNTINNYNSKVAGTITPAGQALVDASLFTTDQLVALGAVSDSVPLGPTTDRASLGWLKTVDLRVSWPIKVSERIVIEPSAAIYNVFNFRNYDINPALRLSSVLSGTAGTVNGTTNALVDRGAERAGQGPGLFSLGTPRQAEFGLKITF